jgi:hypothetical protein
MIEMRSHDRYLTSRHDSKQESKDLEIATIDVDYQFEL